MVLCSNSNTLYDKSLKNTLPCSYFVRREALGGGGRGVKYLDGERRLETGATRTGGVHRRGAPLQQLYKLSTVSNLSVELRPT